MYSQTAPLAQLASRLRRNVFAAGAAVALKMAQSGQLAELSAAAGRLFSSSGKPRSSSPLNGDSQRMDFGSSARRENPSGGIGSGDDDQDAVSRLTQPWVCFAGKKVLLSRSSYRRTHEAVVPGLADVIMIQYGSFHNEKGKVTLVVACRSQTPLIAHWAFANMNSRAGGPWVTPAKQFW